MYYFTADEHYGHEKILDYCKRPFTNICEMDSELIKRHNSVVSDEDIVVHAGDFALCKTREEVEEKYISKLNGVHIFLQGSHDYWLGGKKSPPTIWMQQIDKTLIVVCHYAMRLAALTLRKLAPFRTLARPT